LNRLTFCRAARIGSKLGEETVMGVDPHSQAAEAVQEGRPVEAQYVRQGRRGVRIVWVLAISLALAALATFGFWALHAGQLRKTEDIRRAVISANAFSEGAPAAKQAPPDRDAER
jgi:hypothetical protein